MELALSYETQIHIRWLTLPLLKTQYQLLLKWVLMVWTCHPRYPVLVTPLSWLNFRTTYLFQSHIIFDRGLNNISRQVQSSKNAQFLSTDLMKHWASMPREWETAKALVGVDCLSEDLNSARVPRGSGICCWDKNGQNL